MMPNKLGGGFGNPFKSKQPISTVVDPSKFTDDYGDNVNFITFLSTIYSRLVYSNNRDFFHFYSNIFGKIITDDLMKDMNSQVKNKGIEILLNDAELFGLTDSDKSKYNMETIIVNNKKTFKFLPKSKEINLVLGDQRINKTNSGCNINYDNTITNPNLVFVNISNSNYGDIYVIGDKRMPNIIWLSFRGTSNLKAIGSYLRPSSITPTTIISYNYTDKNGTPKNFKLQVIIGIYKILNENMNIIMNRY